jgi:hypothetical protein
VTGLVAHAPTEGELERLYHELARRGAPSVGAKRPWPYRPRDDEALLALAAEMARYDARLLSILVQMLRRTWRTLNPRALREHMQAMRWPQALLVVLEFARAAERDQEFQHFCDYIAAGWPRIDPAERFFIDAERPASRIARRNLGRNLKPYARWGFVGNERPIVDSVTRRTVGSYDAATRARILEELAAQVAEFSLAEYLEAIDHAVSRQQALIDLRRHPGLVPQGHGRGAKWRLATGRAAQRKARETAR